MDVTAPPGRTALPLPALLALAASVFLGCLTEIVPAGILLPAAADLGVSPAAAGQLVTVYAITTALTALPLTAASARMPRRKLLLLLVAGFVATNLAIALSPWFALVLAARVASGALTGILWSLVANYAMRLVPAERSGRALAVAMAGTPIGFALGVPAGAALGELVGWRWVFAGMALVAVPLLWWIVAVVPPLPGEEPGTRSSLRAVVRTPGIRPLFLLVIAFSLAHNMFYTYLGPFYAGRGHLALLSAGLLLFGTATVAGLWLVGLALDRHPRVVLTCCAAVTAACFGILVFGGREPVLLLAACALWGLAFGGAPTSFQAVTAVLAGRRADIAQSLTIASWNGAVAGGALIGGVLLGTAPGALPWTAIALMVVPVLLSRFVFPAR
ncbi:MFS transporter [Amycolatopsis rubida]|uniref:MFS transporter n=1 Tax=Amycolatopsis rubida TaxID=112413 RepID=A0ABX0BMU7_9PSEU|nr:MULTISPECIES: MFS transporter [Amycolatopsis]MYW89686.1 MFS transporter [Amycolatopsis rubida]NEC54662.1 MFS transporter [Amycolatopsis rubida]OAP23530.1 Purine ribonucleoside efflux pump NepI [Amycolatopsis sp. M39]